MSITARLKTALADRYTIERQLGGSGMGPRMTLMNADVRSE